MKRIKKFTYAFYILSVATLTASCASNLSGEIILQERDVKDFTGVELAISGDVSIEADKDILEKIETVVEDNVLKIKTQKGFSLGWKDSKIIINITLPVVEKLSISGSGDIKATSSIKSDDLLLSISGSGDISIPNLSVNSLSAKISGSGDIEIAGSGTAKTAEASISGSGNINLSTIQFASAEVSIVGSGDANINVTENLNARIVGSGDITYSGKPIVDAKVTGSGELKGM